jgi:hypothetical protein
MNGSTKGNWADVKGKCVRAREGGVTMDTSPTVRLGALRNDQHFHQDVRAISDFFARIALDNPR